MRLYVGGDKGLLLYEDGDVSQLHTEEIECAVRPNAGRLVAGTTSGAILVWDGKGDARVSAKDLGDGVHSLGVNAKGVLFAGSIPAASWTSKDHGETWKELPAFVDAPNHEGWNAPWGTPIASAIGTHPKDPKTIYFGVEVGGIYRSRDAGKKWFDLDLPCADIHAIQVCPANHARVFVTTGEGGFVSDDEGFNWKEMGVNNQRRYTMGLAAHPTEADRVIISAAVSPPPWKDAKCDIYLSTDSGRRFRTVVKGLKGGVQRRALVINPKVPSEIAFGTSFGDVYYSNDGGESFDNVASGLGDIKMVMFT